MFKNEYILNVDIKKKMKAVVPTFVQYDSATLIFKIFDNGKPFDLDGFTRAEVAHKRRDGKVVVGEGVIETLTNDEKVIRYTYMGNEMSKEGFIETSLSVFSDTKKVSIQPFQVNIISNIHDELAVPSNPEYGALQNLIVSVDDLADKAIQATNDAKTATDTMNTLVSDTKYNQPYNQTAQYKKNNVVSFNGSSYIAKQDTKGNPPPADHTVSDNEYWGQIGRKGADGTGTVVRHREEFVATANQSVFTLTNSYDQFQNRIDVEVGGVPQFSPDNFTETSATTFTLSEGVVAGTKVIATYFSEAQPLKTDIETTVNSHTTTLNNNNNLLSQHSTKLNEVTASLAETGQEIETVKLDKATYEYVDFVISNIVSGAPKGTFLTISELQSAHPQGTEGVFLVLENDSNASHIYFWNGTAWTDAGVYQGTGLASVMTVQDAPWEVI